MTARPPYPDCGATGLHSLGPLPDVAFFAARRLDAPLPAGELLHCPHCDLRLRWPRLPDYQALYDNATVEAWTVGALRKDQRLVRALVEALPARAKVLDFGCYSGDFLAGLPVHLAKYGVEVNAAAAAVARQRSGALRAAGAR